MNLHNPATLDERKELVKSLLAGPALEIWIQMKEENGIDPLQEMDKDMYQEVVHDFLLEVIASSRTLLHHALGKHPSRPLRSLALHLFTWYRGNNPRSVHP